MRCPRIREILISATLLISTHSALPFAGNYSVFHTHPDNSLTADGAWALHDMNRPWPPQAEPKPWSELAPETVAPEGAKILFDGSNLHAWIVPEPWLLENGIIRVRPVNLSLATKESFGSCHLHLEWKTNPGNPQKTAQNRGNSGVFLMSTYEIQILDSHQHKTYADGMAGALYGVKPPDSNALRPSGEWQAYDIWFRRPEFNADGKMTTPACVTVSINGIVVQKNVPFEGPSSNKTRKPYIIHADALPLSLQNHNEDVEFRNIWIRPLDDDAVVSPAGPVGLMQ